MHLDSSEFNGHNCDGLGHILADWHSISKQL